MLKVRIKILQVCFKPKSSGMNRDAGKIVGQGGPTGAKGHLLP